MKLREKALIKMLQMVATRHKGLSDGLKHDIKALNNQSTTADVKLLLDRAYYELGIKSQKEE